MQQEYQSEDDYYYTTITFFFYIPLASGLYPNCILWCSFLAISINYSPEILTR